MSENLHKVDELFKQALADHKEEPSSSVWENLDRQLDKKTTTSIYRKYRRLKWVAASSIMLACALGVYTIYTSALNNALTNKKQNLETPHSRITSPAAGKEKNDVAVNFNEKTTTANLQVQHRVSDRDVVKQNTAVAKKINVQSSAVIQSGNRTVRVQNNLPSKLIIAKQEQVGDETNNLPTQESIAATAKKQHQSDLAILNASLSKTGNDAVEANQSYKSINALNELAMPQGEMVLNAAPLLALNLIDATKTPVIKTGLQQQADNSLTAKSIVTPKKSRLSFSVFFSPDFVSSRVVNDQKVFKEDDKREIERTEKRGFSSTWGAWINYKLAKNWSIQSGLTFLTIIKKIEKKGIYARPDSRGTVRYRFNCSSGYTYIDVKSGNNNPSSGDSLYALNSTNTLQYIGVPLSLQYAFTKGKWGIAPSFGASANILTRGRIETVIATGTANERNKTRDIHSLKPLYFSGIAGVSFSYNISKKIAVLLNPRARFALSSINKQGPVKTYQNSIGIAGGLNIIL